MVKTRRARSEQPSSVPTWMEKLIHFPTLTDSVHTQRQDKVSTHSGSELTLCGSQEKLRLYLPQKDSSRGRLSRLKRPFIHVVNVAHSAFLSQSHQIGAQPDVTDQPPKVGKIWNRRIHIKVGMKRTKGLLLKVLKPPKPAMPQRPPPSFAQELIDTIIDAVAASYPNDYLAGKALRKCSLVSKAFLPRCRMHLFREVKFTAQHSNTLRIQRLLPLLEHPLSQIAPYVQILHIRDAFWEPGLPRILSFLSSLRTLHLEMRPGTASWTALSSTFVDALLKTVALDSLEEISLRNLSQVPATFFGLTGNLQRLMVWDMALADEEDAMVPTEAISPPSQLTSLSVRGGDLSLFLPLFESPTPSLRPRLSDVQLVAKSQEDVDACASFLRCSSSSIEKLSFSNRSGDALPLVNAMNYPALREVHIEHGTTFQESPAGLTSGLLNFLSSVSPSSAIHTLNIRIKWSSCNPDAPWNALADSWAEVDQALLAVRTLKSVTVTFIVAYSNGKGVWTHEDISSIENASSSLDEHLPSLLRQTASRTGVQTRVFRESW